MVNKQVFGVLLKPYSQHRGWIRPLSGSCSREWVGQGFVEKHLRIPPQSRKESAQRRSLPHWD